MSKHPPSPKPAAAKSAADPIEDSEVDAVGATVLFGLPWLTTGRVTRLVKFGLVGVSGVVVNLAVFEFFYRLVDMPGALAKMQFTLANALGIVVSIFTNFLLNDAWTWGDRIKGSRRDWFGRLSKYYISASVAAGVQLLVASATNRFVFEQLPLELSAESWLMPQWAAAQVGTLDVGPTLAVLTGIGFGMAINFLASHLWAFRDAEVE